MSLTDWLDAPRWAPQGTCARLPVHRADELFFPEPAQKTSASDAAKRLCGDCYVRQLCLEHALSQPEPFGVWGGTTSEERRAMRREHIEGRNINAG